MKTKENSLLFSTLIAIGIAAVIFVIIGVVFDISFNGNVQMSNYAFSKIAFATLVIALGFGLPTFVYDNENMSLLMKTLIHMGVGCVVMTITSFIVGWIPMNRGILTIVVTIAGELLISFVIWLFFYAYNRKLAKKMSKRIAELNQ